MAIKESTAKQLLALHAQASAMVAQIEAIIEAENGDECQHENAEDQSTMGMAPQSRMWCPDCNAYFSRIEP
jgi:hypothetical protein